MWTRTSGTPDFLSLFECGSPEKIVRLCDQKVDSAIKRADQVEATHPELAGKLWAGVDRRIVDLGAVVDIVNPNGIDFVSERVGNYQHNPQWGILFDQLWVR